MNPREIVGNDESHPITTRESLIAALHEAAEIEHGLLLQYLFAALSLKQSPAEDVSPEQFAALRQWKGVVLSVAVDEMGHLGTVCNLLAAVGASPHFDRPGLPAPTGYYPSRLNSSGSRTRLSDDLSRRSCRAGDRLMTVCAV